MNESVSIFNLSYFLSCYVLIKKEKEEKKFTILERWEKNEEKNVRYRRLESWKIKTKYFSLNVADDKVYNEGDNGRLLTAPYDNIVQA